MQKTGVPLHMPNPIRWIKDWERKWRGSYSADLSTPEARKRADTYMTWADHQFLRHWWTNFYEIAPGVFRSNHPTPKRFRALKSLGIRTVLNLRGAMDEPYYGIEKELCAELGFSLIDFRMTAGGSMQQERLIELIALLKTLELPCVIHCKSGADRTGIVSAIYMMVIEGQTITEARHHLSFKHLHLNNKRTGILDHILDTYAETFARTGISFEDWAQTEYNQAEIDAGFRKARGLPDPT